MNNSHAERFACGFALAFLLSLGLYLAWTNLNALMFFAIFSLISYFIGFIFLETINKGNGNGKSS